MVGADAASPQPTVPSSASMRTSMFSAVAIVTPAIFMALFSGNATGIASTRRTISGALVPHVAEADRCVRSSIISVTFRLDVGGLDDRRPFVHFGLVVRAESFGRHLLRGREFLADVGEPLLHRRIGERAGDRGVELGDDSFGVPFGAHTPCQIET